MKRLFLLTLLVFLTACSYQVKDSLLSLGYSEEEVAKHNVPYLHRHRVRGEKNGRNTNVMVYWYDESYTHEITYTGKVYKEKIQKRQEIKDLLQRTKDLPKNADEAKVRMTNDSNYINVDGKFIRKEWMQNNPEKAKALYGWWFMSHPQECKDIYGTEMFNN